MKKLVSILLFLILLLNFYPSISQSLGKERIEKLKQSVVRILVNGKPSGTGFFMNKDGLIATNFHVIAPAFSADYKSFNDSISIELSNGNKYKVSILSYFNGNKAIEAINYDYCILMPINKPNLSFSYLKLGSFNDIDEGDEIYISGYPMGISQPVIAKGLLSTKWTDSTQIVNPVKKFSRNVAWLDITMNKGNSGGPVIKLGKTYNDDVVVGISTFILNPDAQYAEKIATYISQTNPTENFTEINGLNLNGSLCFISSAISRNSIGVSGLVSIDYLNSVLVSIYNPFGR